MARFETWVKSDLQNPLEVQKTDGFIFSADNGANLIGVEVMDGGVAASLSGVVMGYLIRQDDATVTVEGTLSGNRAYIVLPASAYTIVGQISIVIKVGDTTVGALVTSVYRTTTDTIVDPGHVIPSIADLLALIDECEAARDAANSAAGNATSATTAANTAATLANTRAEAANRAATAANSAASEAETAADAIQDMTVSASGLAAGMAPSVTVTDVNEHKHIAFGIPKGDKGDKGDSGVMVETYGPFWLEVDSTTGNLYVNYTDGTEAPPFVYDSSTGNLYFDFE